MHYIFVLVAEIMAAMGMDNNNVQGIKIYNKEQKISLYVDDTMLCLVAEENDSSNFINFKSLELILKKS